MPIDEFRKSGPPVTEDDIKELERAIGATLPVQYRSFLLRTNGGVPHPQEAFGVRGDRDGGSMLGLFYSLSHEHSSCTLMHTWRAFEGRIPSDLLPIAGDAGDNQICIGIEARNHGKLYLWDMENEAGPGKKPWRRNIRLVADSFNEFLDSFFDVEEEGW